jgi:hypothetical protein
MVTIASREVLDQNYDTFPNVCSEMLNYAGKNAIITDIVFSNVHPGIKLYEIDVDSGCWYWGENFFDATLSDPLEPEEPVILNDLF